ncbi:short-chain alcohol dehydrogenase-like protein [Hahella chejuensis KCTC 2396]|uniref:Short-chain alcohol dehydrogenase-like protein n=1 Tax=Hahella chejuensis (strain KCTC 2396) TaxID=349521 RepID=Q2SNS2_HAHCH|nr:SDR family oxidoreductase [Hahella chejuensis]ABC27702.1 short-chain alcohol dehydrogenase-like protein [Hahella chejuensis KCTC 2396]
MTSVSTSRKVAIITGAGRGIGAATAALAGERGYAVCVNYLRNHQAAQQVVDSILARGGEAIAVQADVSQEEGVQALFAAVDRELGKVTALVNNVGVLERQMRLDHMDAERLTRIFRNNVVSYFLCSREAVKRMSTAYGGCGGVIVNVSSMASKLGSPGEYIDYAASKGAVDSMTIGLAKEVAQEGVRVNCVRPGSVYTEIHASGGEPGRVERVKANIPMRRGGQPEELANAILWLLSAEASYVTGAIVDVSGGL